MKIKINGKSLPYHIYQTKVLNLIKGMCERFEFTIQWGYDMTKISVSKIKVVIEDKRVKKCFEICSANWAGIKLGMATRKYNT